MISIFGKSVASRVGLEGRLFISSLFYYYLKMREFVSERIRNRFVAEIASGKQELGENYSLRNARLIERRIHIKSNSIAAYSHGLS